MGKTILLTGVMGLPGGDLPFELCKTYGEEATRVVVLGSPSAETPPGAGVRFPRVDRAAFDAFMSSAGAHNFGLDPTRFAGQCA